MRKKGKVYQVKRIWELYLKKEFGGSFREGKCFVNLGSLEFMEDL